MKEYDCTFWLKDGKCYKGSNCLFNHPIRQEGAKRVLTEPALVLENKIAVVWDSGDSQHMSPFKQYFINMHKLEKPIPVSPAIKGMEHKTQAEYQGDIELTLEDGSKLVLHNALYVPELEQILISSKQLKKNEGYLHNDSFKDTEHYVMNHSTNHRIPLVDINDTYKIIAEMKHEMNESKSDGTVNIELNAITRSQNKIKMESEVGIVHDESFNYQSDVNTELLQKKVIEVLPNTISSLDKKDNPHEVELLITHHKLGHVNKKMLGKLKQSILEGANTRDENKPIVKELDVVLKDHNHQCVPCDMAKITKSSFKGEYMKDVHHANDQADADLMVLYITVKDSDDKEDKIKRYVSLITDVHTRHVHMRILNKKSEASQHVLDYYHYSKRETGKELKCFHSDNGKEYQRAIGILKSRNVNCTNSPPYTSERNPIAERKNRTLEDMMRALLEHAKLDPFKYWEYAMATAVYIHNRVTVVTGTNKTQHELFPSRVPNLSRLHAFGCDTVSLINLKNKSREKFLPKGELGTFIGYNTKDHSYNILLLDGTIKSTVHVRFQEDKFTLNRNKNDSNHEIILTNRIVKESDDFDSNDSGEEDDDQPKIDTRTLNKINDKIKQLEKVKLENDNKEKLNLRRSTRNRSHTHQTGLNCDDFGAINFSVNTSHPITSSTPSETIYVRDVLVPNTRKQALASPYWKYWEVAEKDELKSFSDMKVFEEVDKPADKNTNVVGCRWVYAIKKEYGKVTKFKARLVAQGFSQVQGIDYDETFSGTVKSKSIRVIMALTAMKGHILETMDFTTAYLNGVLTETIYMQPPPGFNTSGTNKVWLLLKAVYGLNQAGRVWRITLNDFIMKELGFKRLISDQCIYTKVSKKNHLMILSTYVDDIPSSYHPDDHDEWESIKQQFAQSYKIKFLGEAESLLNMKITRDKENNRIYLDQSAYVDMILEEFDNNYAPVSSPSPIDRLSKLDCPTTDKGKLEMKKFPYRRLVGLLMYLSNATRPDIAYAVRNTAQFMENPGISHWKALVTIVKYLKGTKSYGLVFDGNLVEKNVVDKFPIVGYADADWGGNEGRKSTTGGVITLGGNVVDWLCKKQQTAALSSCEAEYIATGSVVQSMLWMDSLLQEMGLKTTLEEMPLRVHNDNQSAIAISKNDVLHHRVRHIDIKHHFITMMDKSPSP